MHRSDYGRRVVGSSAGGGGDGVARVTAAKLTVALQQQMVVDNRPGAAGNIGSEMVARAARGSGRSEWWKLQSELP